MVSVLYEEVYASIKGGGVDNTHPTKGPVEGGDGREVGWEEESRRLSRYLQLSMYACI
jgi:hypothetical protein